MQFPLVSQRVRLRPFELSDVPAAQLIYGDPQVMRWVDDGTARNIEQTEAMIREYIEHQRVHGFSYWALTDAASGELFGDAGLYTRGTEIELGYTLASDRWGKGLATEAGRLCVDAAFDQLDLSELIALVRPANERSTAVASKLGFERTGTTFAYGGDFEVFGLRRPATNQ